MNARDLNNEVFAARRLAAGRAPLGPQYQKIAEKCLQCNFGFGTKLGSKGLQTAVYNDVVCELEVAVHLIEFARTSPTSNTSKNPTGDFLSQYLPSSDCTSIAFAGPLPGRGHINGQVKNNYPYPIYVRQAVAEYSGVTGEKFKVSHNIGNPHIYQIEYSVDRRNRWAWCNLSAEDGAPFQYVDRKLSVMSVDSLAVCGAPGRYGKDEVMGVFGRFSLFARKSGGSWRVGASKEDV
ncbi:hypothetical protein SLS61_004705 [Didymella pomorum]